MKIDVCVEVLSYRYRTLTLVNYNRKKIEKKDWKITGRPLLLRNKSYSVVFI